VKRIAENLDTKDVFGVLVLLHCANEIMHVQLF
jgi:hypothetical protein